VQIQVNDASDIGALVWAARKAGGLRQDDTAGAIGVSENFMVRVESGAKGIPWGKLFQVLSGLGVRVLVDVPEAATPLVSIERDKLQQRRARGKRRQTSAQIASERSAKDGHD
jgi:transcriptional regulator with XRE-family HTH domain